GQLVKYPKALFVAALLMFLLAVVPGLPFFPFAVLGSLLAFVGYAVPLRLARDHAAEVARKAAADLQAQKEAKESVRESLKSVEIELCLGKQLSAKLLLSQGELVHRVTKMRRKFAQQYGFVVPDIKVSDNLSLGPKSYQIKIHGAVVSSHELKLGNLLVVTGDGRKPDLPGEE